MRSLISCVGALMLTVVAAACGSGTSPTTIGTSSAINLTGTWIGSASDSHREAQLTLKLTQQGTNVTGSVTATTRTSIPLYTGGTLTGSVSGSTFTFAISIPTGSVADAPTCSVALSGSTTDLTAAGMTGTYTGTDSCFGDLVGGRFTVAKQ